MHMGGPSTLLGTERNILRTTSITILLSQQVGACLKVTLNPKPNPQALRQLAGQHEAAAALPKNARMHYMTARASRSWPRRCSIGTACGQEGGQRAGPGPKGTLDPFPPSSCSAVRTVQAWWDQQGQPAQVTACICICYAPRCRTSCRVHMVGCVRMVGCMQA